jgi:signal transduction histidine kinase
VIAVIQGVVVLATGGVMSPVVMALLVVCFVASTMPERRAVRLQIAAVIAWLWVVAGLELSGVLGSLLPLPFRNGEGATPAPLFVVALLLVETMLLLVTLGLGAHVRLAFSDLLARETSARDESLRTHAERLDELTRLAGEIAHELKNPLASVKGLAALLARRCREDQQEHLAVLRGEVDRMQATLEEFLNLSRPLVPLTTRATDLAALVTEVAALHEGQLAQKRLRLEVLTEPGGTRRCRPIHASSARSWSTCCRTPSRPVRSRAPSGRGFPRPPPRCDSPWKTPAPASPGALGPRLRGRSDHQADGQRLRSHGGPRPGPPARR